MNYQEQIQEQQEEYTKKLGNLFSIQPVPAKDTISLQNLSKEKQEYLKNVSLKSYLQSQKLQKMFSPFSDTDKDTFINIFDCYPFDPERHVTFEEYMEARGLKKVKEGVYGGKATRTHEEAMRIIRGGGRARQPTPKVDISKPPAGFSKGAWEQVKKLLGEEAARRVKLGKATGVKFEFDEKGRVKKIIRPTATGTKVSYVVYDKAGGREVSEEEYKKLKEKKEQFRELTEAERLAPRVKTEIPAGVVAPYKPKGFLERTEAKLREIRYTKPSYAALAGFGASILGTIKFGKEFITHPIKTTKETGKTLYITGKKFITGEGFPEIGRILKQEPAYATGYIAGEVAQAYGGGLIAEKAAGVARGGLTRISPRYKPIKEIRGKKIITVGEEKIELVKPGIIPKEPVKKQIARAGKEVKPVSAAKDFFNFMIGKVEIKKPSAKGLEKAFFAVPERKLRISRLGLEEPKRAGIIDILAGDITFRRPKSQALIFPEQKLAKFPKSLQPIIKKIREGKVLTKAEQAKLVKWQLTPSGEFKPLGYISPEKEITLAPGEIVYKKRTLGVTTIRGKKVTIIEAGVKKATKRTRELLRKARRGTIIPKEEIELTKRLAKESKLYKPITTKPYYDISRILGYAPSLLKVKYEKSISLLSPVKKEKAKPTKPTTPSYSEDKLPKLISKPTGEYKKQREKVIKIFSLSPPPYKEPHKPIPPIPGKPIKLFKEITFYKGRTKRGKLPRQLAKQPKAYQASVGAVLLGYEVSPEKLKELEKKTFTGLELRPVVRSRKEAERLRRQQLNLLEPAIGTAKKGSPRKAVRQLRKQYAEKLKKMLGYAYWDKERSKARRKVKRGTAVHILTSTSPKKPYNPYKQGESKKAVLKRLQKVFGFGLVKKKQKRKKKK